MEQISTLVKKQVAELEQPTKVSPRNTRVWAEFGDFQTFSEPDLIELKCEAVSFADDLFRNRSPHWLSMLGTSGAGKTMLAKRIAKLFRERRHDRVNRQRSNETRIIHWRGGYINWGKAINRMLDGDYAFLEDLRDYDFFAIDDIISEYAKLRELSASKLYDVLESRLGKWTVITANVTLKQIGELLDPRIASRMIRGDSTVVEVKVPDYNTRKNRT